MYDNNLSSILSKPQKYKILCNPPSMFLSFPTRLLLPSGVLVQPWRSLNAHNTLASESLLKSGWERKHSPLRAWQRQRTQLHQQQHPARAYITGSRMRRQAQIPDIGEAFKPLKTKVTNMNIAHHTKAILQKQRGSGERFQYSEVDSKLITY